MELLKIYEILTLLCDYKNHNNIKKKADVRENIFIYFESNREVQKAHSE